jgi:hypothetical protein
MIVRVPESYILAMAEIAFSLFLFPKSYEATRPTSVYMNLISYIANNSKIYPSTLHEDMYGEIWV